MRDNLSDEEEAGGGPLLLFWLGMVGASPNTTGSPLPRPLFLRERGGGNSLRSFVFKPLTLPSPYRGWGEGGYVMSMASP